MKYYDIEQNTEEWLSLRLGKFTASTFSDLFMKKETAGYRKAIRKVAFEKLTGESPESFRNEWMDRGHELEPMAKEAYELLTFNTVQNGGFFELDEWTGASPDGLIGEDGILEIKSPAYSTMIDCILTNRLPSEYVYQGQGQLFVTGRQWCDFVSYHQKLPLVLIRVDPDPVIHEQLRIALDTAIKEASEIIEKIKSKL